MTATLAVDLGTGSCRAILFDLDGHQLAASGREWSHAELPGYPGSQVFDTATNWTLICACIREAIAAAGLSPRDVAGVSATSMREGVLLLNTARAELLDEDALMSALASGHVGGAALDIARPTPAGAPRPLLDHPNVVILNHIGGSSWETLRRGGELAAAEVERLAKGEALLNVANRAGLAAREAEATGAAR